MDIWSEIIKEVKLRAAAEKSLGSYLENLVISRSNIIDSISSILASKLNSEALSASDLKHFIFDALTSDKDSEKKIISDLLFFKANDPACKYYSTPLLFYKGFQGLVSYRAAFSLWNDDRHTMALFLQNRASEIFGVDIHPAAKISGGVMIDHATGVVIGETCEIEENVSIFQGVTLGGTGKETGDRHPKVREGVLISSAAQILGNVEIGKGAKVAAGSVVLSDVEPNTTVAGVPAIVVGKPSSEKPATDVDHTIEEA